MFRAGLLESIDEPLSGSVFGEEWQSLVAGEREEVSRAGTFEVFDLFTV